MVLGRLCLPQCGLATTARAKKSVFDTVSLVEVSYFSTLFMPRKSYVDFEMLCHLSGMSMGRGTWAAHSRVVRLAAQPQHRSTTLSPGTGCGCACERQGWVQDTPGCPAGPQSVYLQYRCEPQALSHGNRSLRSAAQVRLVLSKE